MTSLQNDQKKKRRPSSAGKPKNDTDFGEEWQRRMIDIFGEPQSPPAPRSPERRTKIPNEQSIDQDHPLAQALKSASAESIKLPKPQLRNNTVKTAGKELQPPSASSSSETGRHAPYSRIIDGFDLESAVIYSEILKPKFEEY